MEKCRQYTLDVLWRGPHLEHTGVAALKQLGALADRTDKIQQAAAIVEQLLAFAGQHQAATNPVEQFQAEFLFERGDLPGERWLGDM